MIFYHKCLWRLWPIFGMREGVGTPLRSFPTLIFPCRGVALIEGERGDASQVKPTRVTYAPPLEDSDPQVAHFTLAAQRSPTLAGLHFPHLGRIEPRLKGPLLFASSAPRIDMWLLTVLFLPQGFQLHDLTLFMDITLAVGLWIGTWISGPLTVSPPTSPNSPYKPMIVVHIS